MDNNRNQRVFNNSLFLIIRLVIVMFISLYTSRVIINVLGVEDFGIFNVIVGFISIFALISESFGSAFSRFLTVAIANNDIKKQQEIFSTSLNILLIFTTVIVLIGEFVGTWYFAKVANIPIERKGIINIIYQLALLTFILNMLKVCCTSMLIAYEKTNVYGIFSIIDTLLKLGIVYLISISPVDKLVSYVLFLFFVSGISTIMNGVYCKIHFKCFLYKRGIPKIYYKKISQFAFWNFIGLLSYVFSTQGLTLLINSYIGVICNAARGIAIQVDGATRQFVYSLSMAINPQIIKSYTTEDYGYLNRLLFFSSKCYCFVMLLYAIPLAVEANMVLKLWLNIVPEYTVTFVRLTFISTFFVLMARPFEVALQATGNLRISQTITLIFSIFSIFIYWILLKYEISVYIIYVLYTVYTFSLLIVQLVCIKHYININFLKYLKEVFIKIILVALLSIIIPLYLVLYLPETLNRLFFVIICSAISTLLLEMFIGFSKNERQILISILKKLLKIN